MAERMTRVECWEYMSHIAVKSGVTVEKGNAVGVEFATGKIVSMVAGGGSAALLALGTAEETVVGDGTKTVRIHLFQERRLHRFDNVVGGGAIALTDFQVLVYWADSKSLTKTATNNSAAGRVWNVTAQGVLILPTGTPG